MGSVATTHQAELPTSPLLGSHQYLTFTVAGDLFACEIQQIKEIIEYGRVTQVPMMPSFVRGVINLRGNVVPVVDLAARFNREPTPITKRTCIVIIEWAREEERQDIGVVVGSVCEVLEIGANDIEPAPAFGTHLRSDFIQGMGKVQDQFVVVLAMERVLALGEIAVPGAGSAAEDVAAGLPPA